MVPVPKKQLFLKRWLLQGIIFTLPLALTFATFFWIVDKADLLLSFLGTFWPINLVPIPLTFPGLGLALVIVSLIIIGALTESVIVKHALRLFNHVMSKVPFVRTIHPTVLKFAETVLGGSQDFRKVALVEYPRSGVFVIGFIAGVTLDKISKTAGTNLISVFIPNSPLPTTGLHLLVPVDQVIELDMTPEDAFKLVVSSGVVKN